MKVVRWTDRRKPRLPWTRDKAQRKKKNDEDSHHIRNFSYFSPNHFLKSGNFVLSCFGSQPQSVRARYHVVSCHREGHVNLMSTAKQLVRTQETLPESSLEMTLQPTLTIDWSEAPRFLSHGNWNLCCFTPLSFVVTCYAIIDNIYTEIKMTRLFNNKLKVQRK